METYPAGSLLFAPPDPLPSLMLPVRYLGRLSYQYAPLPSGFQLGKINRSISRRLEEGREESEFQVFIPCSLLVRFAQTACSLDWRSEFMQPSPSGITICSGKWFPLCEESIKLLGFFSYDLASYFLLESWHTQLVPTIPLGAWYKEDE